MNVIHIGSGIIIRQIDDQSTKQKFAKVWPRDYSASAKEKNKQTPDFVEHLDALTHVIESIWPSTTKEKFVGLVGFGGRYPFHQGRLDVLMKYLNHVWDTVVNNVRKSPFKNVENDILNAVCSRVRENFNCF